MNDASGQAPDAAVLAASPFDEHCGLRVLEAGGERVRATVAVEPQLLQPTGVVHGGVYATIAEGIASLGTNHAVHARGAVAMGMTNSTSFLRPISAGTIEAEAVRVHLGWTTAVWDVSVRDDEGRLCAVARVTLAVRPARG